jgi:hypothetical protein
MKLIIYGIALTMWALALTNSYAQETPVNSKIEILNKAREGVVNEEKEALKSEVEIINNRLENNQITPDDAEKLKNDAAEKHALNIENRLAIIDNKIALLERNNDISEDEEGDGFVITIGSSGDKNNFPIYIGKKDKPIKYDRRTTSDIVFAAGLNNVIIKGQSLEDSPYKIGGSRFAEIGWAWKTRVFKDNNWVRIKYGVSFQFNGLKPEDNQYFVDTGSQTELQEYPLELDKSKFRMDNLVIPIHFEFGPSKKIEKEDYFRYSTHNKIKVGLGGYAGINLGSRQKLKFNEDGEDIKQKLKADYNTNTFIYGVSAYIGWRGAALYAKYDLNTIFKDNPVQQRNVSLGLRFDVD